MRVEDILQDAIEATYNIYDSDSDQSEVAEFVVMELIGLMNVMHERGDIK